MWTKQYKYELIKDHITEAAQDHLHSKPDEYNQLYQRVIEAVRLELDKTLNRMLTKAPAVDSYSEFFFASQDGYHAIVYYKVLPSVKLIVYSVIVCNHAELKVLEKNQPHTVTWYLPDNQDKNDYGNMPPTLPASGK